MLAFAEREFVLSAVQSDGCSLRDHLRKDARYSGIECDLITTAPPMPEAAAHVWQLFCDARAETPAALRIPATTMQALEWATGVKMQLWERQAIRRLDSLYFRVRANDDRSQSDN